MTLVCHTQKIADLIDFPEDNHLLCSDSEIQLALNLWLYLSTAGHLPVCHLREREKGTSSSLPHPGMKHVTFSHSSLARTSYMAPSDLKRSKKHSHPCTWILINPLKVHYKFFNLTNIPFSFIADEETEA